MTGGLPRITASEATRAIERAGFYLSRQSGSHRIYRNNEGKRVTIPYHSGRTLHPKVVRNIIRDSGLTAAEFMRLL